MHAPSLTSDVHVPVFRSQYFAIALVSADPKVHVPSPVPLGLVAAIYLLRASSEALRCILRSQIALRSNSCYVVHSTRSRPLRFPYLVSGQAEAISHQDAFGMKALGNDPFSSPMSDLNGFDQAQATSPNHSPWLV
jgi:hypothetical protein